MSQTSTTPELHKFNVSAFVCGSSLAWEKSCTIQCTCICCLLCQHENGANLNSQVSLPFKKKAKKLTKENINKYNIIIFSLLLNPVM